MMGLNHVNDLCLLVIVDAKVAFSLGDMKGMDEIGMILEWCMVLRREQLVSKDISVYCSKALLHENGGEHVIVIRCIRHVDLEELSVYIIRKRVVSLRRLRWNFRGIHTILLDGSPIYIMWDVYSCLLCSPCGHAIFLFRRSRAYLGIVF